LFPQTCNALAIVKPDTVIRWHRAGFRSYWRPIIRDFEPDIDTFYKDWLKLPVPERAEA
jgi:acetone carboxylase gamma subunit